MATIAMRAARRPYSRRSWPSSAFGNFSFANRRKIATASGDGIGLSSERGAGSAMLPARRVTSELRRRRELVGDGLEDRLHASTRRGHRGDRDQRDERHEQRVLEQVLAFVVGYE